METGNIIGVRAAAPDDAEPWNYESSRVQELQADVDHLRDQLGDAQHRARKADWELDRFKARTAEVLSTLGRELVALDTDLGDVVLAAMQELDG